MGKIDPEKREQWREDSTPPDTWQDRRILDLLDALDSTESDLRVSEAGRAFDKVVVKERDFYKDLAINAERELDTLKRSESFDVAAAEDALTSVLSRLRYIETDEAVAMDLWWRACDDDWAVPNWLPGKFLGEVRRALKGKVDGRG